MSIELESPKTLMGKLDAASNFIAQARLATRMTAGLNFRDKALEALDTAERFVFEAMQQMESEAVE